MKKNDLLLIGRDGGEREKLELEHLKRNKKGSAQSFEKGGVEEEREKKKGERKLMMITSNPSSVS